MPNGHRHEYRKERRPNSSAKISTSNGIHRPHVLDFYVPQLTSAPGVAAYFRHYKGHRFASTKGCLHDQGLSPAGTRFRPSNVIPMIRFQKGMRKDDVMQKRLRSSRQEGVVSSASPRRKRGCRARCANTSAMAMAPFPGLITPPRL